MASKRIRRVFGTPLRPRLCIFRSLRYIYAQVIDDTSGYTLISASSLELNDRRSLSKTEDARRVGELVGERALERGIGEVAFDRRRYKYHGRIKALADAAREAGLRF